MTSAAVAAKARRLLEEGRIEPMDSPMQLFRSRGDTGIYWTLVTPSVRICTCEHGRKMQEIEAEGEIEPESLPDCSHIVAAREWRLAQRRYVQSRSDCEIVRYEDALARRKHDDMRRAEATWLRPGAGVPLRASQGASAYARASEGGSGAGSQRTKRGSS